MEKEFLKWFRENLSYFRENNFTRKKIAYASWLEGGKGKAELLEALIKAKELIKEWHNIGTGEMGEGLWAIYEEKSPEMQPINKAIKKATV